jgi:hypothetical protein
MGLTEEDYGVAVGMVKDQRDTALAEAEAQRIVAREVLAMERLGFSQGLGFTDAQKWNDLVELSRKSLGLTRT